MTIRRTLLMALGATGLTLANLAAAAEPQAFTATYKVLRHGSAIGESTLSLSRKSDGTWRYASSMKGTSGLAALLGANVEETSTFRWHDDAPEALSYDYSLDASIKTKERHVKVDWKTGKVDVDDGSKGRFNYATTPGMVERHSLPLALAWALDDGKQEIALPVAVQNRVQVQRFAVTGKDKVQVPAGSFQAVRVDRTDDEKGFSAWYVPGRYPVPVKLAQSAGGDITMLLRSFKRD